MPEIRLPPSYSAQGAAAAAEVVNSMRTCGAAGLSGRLDLVRPHQENDDNPAVSGPGGGVRHLVRAESDRKQSAADDAAEVLAEIRRHSTPEAQAAHAQPSFRRTEPPPYRDRVMEAQLDRLESQAAHAQPSFRRTEPAPYRDRVMEAQLDRLTTQVSGLRDQLATALAHQAEMRAQMSQLLTLVAASHRPRQESDQPNDSWAEL